LLSHVNCAFAPGTLTALVGPTGAGKTTLIDCALGLIPPFSGDVLTDGRPLADMAQWRRALGYLGQEPMLFAASVRDNVRWGREDVDDAAVTQALRQACADFVFERGGLEAMIGQGGGALSGGERQRLALARALAGKPRFLVLDEATSALDPETEVDVMRAVHTLRGQTTVLCITHRFGWLREADQVLVLDGGRIVESGTADGLQAARGRFAAMAQSVSQSRSEAASLASERP
jgi:ABC-type multidrug transport system fused ATPase/permease subunit